MPQSRNWRVAADHVPNGKGSIISSLTDTSIMGRRRALHKNQGESSKLESTSKLLEKHCSILTRGQAGVIARLHQSLAELEAYHRVVDEDFRADKFDTLKWGYKLKEAKKDPERFQRFVYETRIYHSGFNKRTLRRQVDHKLKVLDPQNIREVEKKQKIDEMKAQTLHFNVDRQARSMTIILNDFKKKKEEHFSPRRKDVLSHIGEEIEPGDDS